MTGFVDLDNTRVVIGERIGAYTIQQQIGEGGMGSVFLAEHAMLGRRAAIKMLHASISSQPDLTARFFNEARAAAAIRDPGIVQIFDFGQHTDGRAYIVMELLEGEPLDRRLARLGRLQVRDALRIMRQVASSLGAAHARGIVHRDLKPDNVFLVRDPEVASGERAKILDFGIAKISDATGSKTETSVVMGTPLFMSPEQCRGAGKVDQRSDVYSLGCLLFVLLTGRTPFVGEGPGDIIAMHLREPPPAPSSLTPGLPPAIDAVVLRCMEKEPGRRYPSATAVAEALEALHATNTGGLATQAAPSASVQLPAAAHSTTLSSYPQVQTRAKRARSSGYGWLLVSSAIAAIAITAVIITLRSDAAPVADEALEQGSAPTPAAVPAVSAPSEPAAAVEPSPAASAAVVPSPAAPSPAASAAVAPSPAASAAGAPSPAAPSAPARTTPAPAAPVAVAPSAPARTTPAPAAPVAAKPTPPAVTAAPVRPAPGKVPPQEKVAAKPALPDLDNLGACAAQRTKLEALIKRSYSAPARSLLAEAKALTTKCFDNKQLLRLAMIAVPAACTLNDKAAVFRFGALAPVPAVRNQCKKFLAADEAQ